MPDNQRLSTGVTGLDKLLGGGLLPGTLCVVVGSTGIGKGVAIPHVRHDKIKKITAAIGVNQRGIDFNALDTAPVFSIVLLLSPEQQRDEHLQAMENIFSHLQNDTFRRFLRQATDVDAVVDLLHEADTQQLQG